MNRVVIFSLTVVFLLSISILEIGTSFGDAEIESNTGIITLDRSIYTIPTESGSVKISIIISDPDFNKSANGADKIAEDIQGEPGVGPIKISINRGDRTILAYAGSASSNDGPLDSSPIEESALEKSRIRHLGPIAETSPISGIFQFDITIKNTDGPESSKCPPLGISSQDRFDDSNEFSRHCILEGDVLLVEYTDPSDSSGNPRTVASSATFSVLSSAQPYGGSSEKISATKTIRIGHPLTLLLYDSNLNFDSDKAETYSLDLIQFESENIRTTLGPLGGVQSEFDPKPAGLRETDVNTGVFYTVIEVPRTIDGKLVNVGEKIEFEYTQRGLGAYLVVHQEDYSPRPAQIPLNTGKQTENSPEKTNEKICRPGFVKIFKYTGTPACVTPSTAEKLLERGWAKS